MPRWFWKTSARAAPVLRDQLVVWSVEPTLHRHRAEVAGDLRRHFPDARYKTLLPELESRHKPRTAVRITVVPLYTVQSSPGEPLPDTPLADTYGLRRLSGAKRSANERSVLGRRAHGRRLNAFR